MVDLVGLCGLEPRRRVRPLFFARVFPRGSAGCAPITIPDLDPGTEHHVRVYAKNEVGFGPPTEALILKIPGPRLPFPRTSHAQVLCRGHHRQEMGCAGRVNGSLGAHEWEGKSVRTHMSTFGQVHVHVRHHGGTERPEPRARAWFVHVDKSGARAWSLAVAVLRALVRGGKGA
jgi:hypothetical protein